IGPVARQVEVAVVDPRETDLLAAHLGLANEHRVTDAARARAGKKAMAGIEGGARVIRQVKGTRAVAENHRAVGEDDVRLRRGLPPLQAKSGCVGAERTVRRLYLRRATADHGILGAPV